MLRTSKAFRLVGGVLLFGAVCGCSHSNTRSIPEVAGRPSTGATSTPASAPDPVTRPVPLSVSAARSLEAKAQSGRQAMVAQALDVPAGHKLDPELVDGLARMRRSSTDHLRGLPGAWQRIRAFGHRTATSVRPAQVGRNRRSL